MDFGLLCIVFCAGFAAGLVGGEIMDRNDVLYHCPRCRRRDEETVEKCRAQVNTLLSEAASGMEQETEYCSRCDADVPFYRRVMKDGLYIRCNVCHFDINYDPIDFDSIDKRD